MISKENKDKVFSNINYYLLLFLACGPIIFLFISILFSDASIDTLFYICSFLFVVVFVIYFVLTVQNLKFGKIKDKLVLTMVILLTIGLTCVLISTFIRGYIINALQILMYVMLFFSVLMLNKKQTKVFLFILISNFALSCLLGIMDPTGYVVPGFQSNHVQSSLFFFHSNYSQAIAVMLIVLTYHLLLKEKNPILTTFYAIYFVLIGLHMFINSSSVGITCVFLIMITNIIVDWIRTKKFPLRLFLIFLTYTSFAFLVELYPGIYYLRSAHYNYFIEMFDVFDNIFGTNLTKEWFNIDFVPGSNGWERDSLLVESIAAVWGNSSMGFGERLVNILFGLGGGHIHILRPHNMFVGAWVDFGIIFAISLYAIIILGLVYVIRKFKHNINDIMPYVYATIGYLFVTMFGSMIVYHFMYFVIVFALMLNTTKRNHLIEQKRIGYKILHSEEEQK